MKAAPEGQNLAGVGHILPGTRDYAEARDAIRVIGKGEACTVYHCYEQVIQVNILLDTRHAKTEEDLLDLCAQGRGLAALLAKEDASTVPGIYLVW